MFNISELDGIVIDQLDPQSMLRALVFKFILDDYQQEIEVLWLGRELDEDPYIYSDMDGDAFDHPDCCEICVRRSFEHGLKKLVGLTKLRELNLSRMDHKTCAREIAWLQEQWPQMTVLGKDDPPPNVRPSWMDLM
ncbi:hypothetical protein BGZ82_007518 [Podila clonocystis]|nr:hypothetical protein BGZ82_007518 [Podila clonocystis]